MSFVMTDDVSCLVKSLHLQVSCLVHSCCFAVKCVVPGNMVLFAFVVPGNFDVIDYNMYKKVHEMSCLVI